MAPGFAWGQAILRGGVVLHSALGTTVLSAGRFTGCRYVEYWVVRVSVMGVTPHGDLTVDRGSTAPVL